MLTAVEACGNFNGRAGNDTFIGGAMNDIFHGDTKAEPGDDGGIDTEVFANALNTRAISAESRGFMSVPA